MLLSEVKDNLLVMFKNPSCRNKKYKFKDIRRFACALNGWKIDLVRDALLELEEEGLIYVDSQGYYREFPYILGLVQGPIAINKHGEGYITDQDGNKLLIQPKDLGGALNGDIIIAKKTKKMSHGHVVAKTDKIIKRSTGMLIVEVHEKDGEMVLEPFSATLDGPVIINGMAMKPLVDGDRIMVKIGLKNEDKSYYAGFIKYIGHKDDPDADLKMIAIENNIAIDFSKEAMEEAHALPTEVLDNERVGRLDLTNEVIFSIDGAKTKDRDDAISIKINEKGNYVLGVHIADVSHYVKPGTKLWEEALQRSTSVYMVDTVIPMLPHILSNGICSLNPYVDRLTLSCVMELTPQGELVDFDFVDCVINSKKAMTYEDVNSILEDGVVPEDYEEYVDDLQLMERLARKLEKRKIRRGYVDLGNHEVNIEMNDGKPVKFSEKKTGIAEKIIENFMLMAGECAASYIVLPTTYRVHERPDEERVEDAFDMLEKSGIRVKSTHDICNGHVIQKILDQIKDEDDRNIAASIILRSMKRARYSVENVGHFGLGLHGYDQFTSPIRRAPDLVTHRNIRMQRDNKFNVSIVDSYYEEIDKFCQHATLKERNADQAERDASQFEMKRYMAEHIGEKFMARVVYINSRGIYIKTSDGIDGKLLIEDIDGDDFFYDPRTNSFNGKKTKVRIKLGTELCLAVVDTKKEYRTINFGLEYEDLYVMKMKKSAK